MPPIALAKQLARNLWVAAFYAVLLPCLMIVEPFARIRIGYISNQRIGHLAINTEAFLRDKDLNGWPKRTFYVFVVWDPANRQLLEMYKRRLLIVESRLLSHIFFACQSALVRTRFHQPMSWGFADHTRKNLALINRGGPTVSFTAEEEKQGRELLDAMGLGPDDWFACFHARDSAYFNQWRPHLAGHWATTEHRNADIDTYLTAARHIAASGGYALRMGAVVDRPLEETGNERIIDYATIFRSDFGDIYLLAKCRFMLAANTGLVNVPLVFNKPVAMANMSPLGSVVYRAYDLFIPVLLRRTESGEPVPFEEARNAGLFARDVDANFHDICRSMGYEQTNNSEDEILDLCRDMMDFLDGVTPTSEAREVQMHYQNRFQDYFGENSGIGFIGPRFALKYRDLIAGPS